MKARRGLVLAFRGRGETPEERELLRVFRAAHPDQRELLMWMAGIFDKNGPQSNAQTRADVNQRYGLEDEP